MRTDNFKKISFDSINSRSSKLAAFYDYEKCESIIPMGDYMVSHHVGEDNYQVEGLKLILSSNIVIDGKEYHWVCGRGVVVENGMKFDGITFHLAEVFSK